MHLLTERAIGTELETLVNAHCWHNVTTPPIHNRAVSSEKPLDIFVANFDTDGLVSEVTNYAISGHLPIFLCVREGFHNQERKP